MSQHSYRVSARCTEQDRGASLIEYSLLVCLIAIGGFVAVSAVGNAMSNDFDQVAEAMETAGPGATTTTTSPLSPKEKWDKAQADWDAAIDAAKAKNAADVAAAKSTFNAAKAANAALPKAEKNAANKQANSEFTAAKAAAKTEHKAANTAANKAKADAKTEYQATK